MKNRSKNRRHQTAYEAPEVEGEFLNESADTMLSVSDSLGNLTSSSMNEIDSSLLEEFNEDQGANFRDAVESPSRPMKNAQKPKIKKAHSPAQINEQSVRAMVQETLKTTLPSKAALQQTAQTLSVKAQDFLKVAKKEGGRLSNQLKTKPYLLALGAVVAGFALARIVAPSPNHRRA